AIVWLGLAPGFIHFCRPPQSRPALPMMALSGLFYAVFFGAPAFLAHFLIGSGAAHDDPRIAFYAYSYVKEVSAEAQLLVIAAMVLMFGIWTVFERVFATKLPRFRLPSASDGALQIAAWILALANLAYLGVDGIARIPSIGQFLKPAGYVAFAAFYLLRSSGRLPRWQAWPYFFGVLPAWIATQAATGFLSATLLLVMLWLALRFYTKHVLPWRSGLVLVLLFILIYPSLAAFRFEFWYANPNSSLGERIVGIGKVIATNAFNWDKALSNDTQRYVGLIRRVALILPFSHVVETTPAEVPYWQGNTYRTLFTGWIPRALWPGKPEERWGNEFGRRYGILAPEEREMSINLPWITEMYANFGRTGVIVGMALCGLFLGFLNRFLNAPGAGAGEVAIAAGLLFPLFYQESNFTVMTGTLIPQIVCFWIFFAVIFRLAAPTGAGTRPQ
ncbi:MAG: hypothetical protein VW338_15010, partial [Rhodospirillaceae bacterium]